MFFGFLVMMKINPEFGHSCSLSDDFYLSRLHLLINRVSVLYYITIYEFS